MSLLRLARGAALVLLALTAGQAKGEEFYQDFSQKGAGFHGPGRELEAPDTLSAVRLGLLGPSKGTAGKQLWQGAALAVEEANAAGGYVRTDGRKLPYEIVFLPDDGPWGVVARQVVRLCQEDRVWAVVGALDGERAHAAELVVAKLWVPVVTPAAGDLTIDYANVPWVFRLMPDDRSQAELLLRAAREHGWKRLALATEGARDARLASERILEAARRQNESLLLHVEYDPYAPGGSVSRLTQVRPDALLVWGRPEGAVELIAGLRRAGLHAPVLVPAPLVAPETAARSAELGALFGAAPLDMEGSDPGIVEFRDRYQQRTGEAPGVIAGYTYEATRMVISALERAGLNRARLRDELARLPYAGLTGEVSFNSLGGYGRPPVLVELRDGRWVAR